MQKLVVYRALSESQIFRDYVKAFHEGTGLSLTLLGPTELLHREKVGRNENSFCAMMAKRAGSCGACMKLQAEALAKIGAAATPQEVRCFSGLTDIAVPVLIGNQHIATLYGGQVFRGSPRRASFPKLIKDLKAWGFEGEGIKAAENAYFATKVITQKEFHALVRLLQIFSQHLADAANRLVLVNGGDEPAAVTWRNGTTHIVLTPMEFMQRLAALVPRPRLHLIRFHGVLAPNAKLRSKVVPVPPQAATVGEGDCAHSHGKPARMTWARLLKRVFDIDVEQCQCGGKLKLVAVIEEPAVIGKILTHIGLDPQPPPRAKARRVVLFDGFEAA